MPAPKKDRRSPDPRIDDLSKRVDHLHECMEEVKKRQDANSEAIRENTRITLSIAQNAERAASAAETVRDVQATFKVTLALGKWIGAIGAAAAGVIAAVKGWRS